MEFVTGLVLGFFLFFIVVVCLASTAEKNPTSERVEEAKRDIDEVLRYGHLKMEEAAGAAAPGSPPDPPLLTHRVDPIRAKTSPSEQAAG